jgi:hypothetical protein
MKLENQHKLFLLKRLKQYEADKRNCTVKVIHSMNTCILCIYLPVGHPLQEVQGVIAIRLDFYLPRLDMTLAQFYSRFLK